jgi:hypothetical protein
MARSNVVPERPQPTKNGKGSGDGMGFVQSAHVDDLAFRRRATTRAPRRRGRGRDGVVSGRTVRHDGGCVAGERARGTAPVTAGSGDIEVTASGTGCDGEALVQGVTLTRNPAGTALPRTGSSSSWPMARLAVSLLVVGGLAVFASRWRQRRTATLGA